MTDIFPMRKVDYDSTAWELNRAWLRDHEREYRGSWIALYKGALIAHGADSHEVFEEAKEICPTPLFLFHYCAAPLDFTGLWEI